MNHENRKKKKSYSDRNLSLSRNLNTTPENSLNTLIRKTKTKRENTVI
jgi:hypothetical protein